MAPGKRDGREHFKEWVKNNSGAVMVETTEEFGGIGPLNPASGFGTRTTPPRTFVIFKTSRELPWGTDMAGQIGFPTKAPASIRSSDDTVQKPSVDDPASATTHAFLILAALAALAWFVTKK